MSDDEARPGGGCRDGRPLPSGAAIRRALAGWRPPMPFTVVVEYDRAAGRASDHLWVAEFMADQHGHKLYLAVGPGGDPVPMPQLIRAVRRGGMPGDCGVQLVLGRDRWGRSVFKPPAQNLN